MINGPNILVADFGTSSLKIGLINRQGVLLWYHREPMLREEKDLKNWNTGLWVQALKNSLALLPLEPVSAVVFSGNGPTLVPLDEHDAPLDPVLLWIDGRAMYEEGNVSFFLPKVRWYAHNRPRDFE